MQTSAEVLKCGGEVPAAALHALFSEFADVFRVFKDPNINQCIWHTKSTGLQYSAECCWKRFSPRASSQVALHCRQDPARESESRSTTVSVFSLRSGQEICIEQQRPLYVLLIDKYVWIACHSATLRLPWNTVQHHGTTAASQTASSTANYLTLLDRSDTTNCASRTFFEQVAWLSTRLESNHGENVPLTGKSGGWNTKLTARESCLKHGRAAVSIVVLYEMGHDERSVHSCLATWLLHSNAQPTHTDVLMYSVSETFTVRVALFMAAVDISEKVTNIPS